MYLKFSNITISIVSYSMFAFQTTFILKRRTRPELSKAHKNPRTRRLKARHFLYDFVEDTNVRKQEPVKVILKTSVEGV